MLAWCLWVCSLFFFFFLVIPKIWILSLGFFTGQQSQNHLTINEDSFLMFCQGEISQPMVLKLQLLPRVDGSLV
jgi:hypothetical protein